MVLFRGNPELDQWKAKALAGEQPAHSLLRKYFLPDAAIKAAGDGTYAFVISTPTPDRDRDVLEVAGWRLDNYLKNPVVLLCHNYYGLPIGQAVSVEKGATLTARMQFVGVETYPLAGTVRGLVDGGFLRATSVGFDPLKWVYNEERRGYDFSDQELLEFSIVPVPANPEALLEAKAAGVDVGPLKSWAEQILDGLEPGIWIPKDVAARVLKISTGEPVTLPVPAPPETKTPTVPAYVPSPDSFRLAMKAGISDVVNARLNKALGRID